ncbi:MAG: YdeI/OmpD-associated family protein [Candidatus Norongarragalinales archaeon]
MKITKKIYVTTARQWRAWLKKNHGKAKEVWLVYYKKHSGKKRIPYNDAVDEALCFGWIDSTVKTIDKDSFAQRFTPRRPLSKPSQMNKERMRKLARQGRMTKTGLDAVAHAFHPKKREKFAIAKDVLAALKADEAVWKNFRSFPAHYRRIRIAYVENYRDNPGQFKKSLENLVRMTRQNKKFGMVQ